MSNIMQPQNHEHKYRLLALGLGIAAVALVGLIAFTLITKKSADDKKKAATNTEAADVVGQGELQGNEQRGTGKIETDCYFFEVPRSVSLGTNQYCAVDLGYGSGETNLLVVAPTKMYRSEGGEVSFEKSLEAYKKQLQVSATTIDSEEAFKLDGQDAVRLTTTQQSQKKILVFAKTNSTDRLDSTGAVIEGILITTPNDTKEQSEVVAGVVKTWKWR